MDCRREIFYFPVTRQYLGACGEGELVWKSQRPTLPVDLRADDFLLACAQQGWQKAVRGGGPGTRGAGSLRYEVRRVRSLSFRNFGGQRQVLQRWAVGSLCQLPGGNTVEKQMGWQPAK